MKQSTSFGHLGLKQEILEAIEDAGFTHPSPIQEQAIPEILAGCDMITQGLNRQEGPFFQRFRGKDVSFI